MAKPKEAKKHESKKTPSRRGGARPNTGGARPGAGRPVGSTSVKNPRVPFPSRVDVATLAALRADQRDDESVGETLDRWAKERRPK